MSDVIIIEVGQQERTYWRDVWRYRELFYVLAWRDLTVRYKQTVIGAAWAVIRPVGNSCLISKVYFPRLIVPTAMIVVALADFLITFCILIAMMVWYQFAPGWQIFALLAFLVLAFLASTGPSLWLTSLNVKYRDFRYVVPFMVQLGLYISPVGFSSSIVAPKWRVPYSLNPMVGVIDGFRWWILGGQTAINYPSLAIGVAVTAFFVWFGVRGFRKTEKSFADLI